MSEYNTDTSSSFASPVSTPRSSPSPASSAPSSPVPSAPSSRAPSPVLPVEVDREPSPIPAEEMPWEHHGNYPRGFVMYNPNGRSTMPAEWTHLWRQIYPDRGY